MPIDAATAQQLSRAATEKVLKRWASYIPPELSNTQASSIFVLHSSDASLRAVFTPIWNTLFQRVVQSPDPADKVTLPGGFVTPEDNRLDRKIHVNLAATEYDWSGLFAHEFVHWLSHPNFYSHFFQSQPGRTNDIVEGVTEYIWLKCFKGHADGLTASGLQQYNCACQNRGVAKLKKDERAVYNWTGQYDRAKHWIKSSPGNEDAVLKFVFQGKHTNLPF